jgi:non-heme chloroperoxidase
LDPKKVLVNGAVLNYVEQGSGNPVIFVHGSQGDYRTWLPIMKDFASRYQAIAYSRRYHWPNEWTGSGTDYTPSRHADDLIAFIETLNLAPAYVVGNSFGAYTTLVTAIRRPDLLHKVVIGEPPMLTWLKNIQGGQEYFDGFMQKAWIPATQAFQAGDLEQGVRLFVDGVSGQTGTFDQIPEEPRQRMMDNAAELQAETMSPEYFTVVTHNQVKQISLPMLLLKGEHSPKMFHLIIDELAACAPHAKVITIPNTGHAIYSGNPQEYTQKVMEFLA